MIAVDTNLLLRYVEPTGDLHPVAVAVISVEPADPLPPLPTTRNALLNCLKFSHFVRLR